MTDTPSTPPPLYTGEDRRIQNPGARQEIGEDKILSEPERKNVVTRLLQGVFGRKNSTLRQALGGEKNILGEEERQTTLAIITQAITKFVKAGVSRAKEEEKKKASFVEMLRHRQQMQEKERGRGREK